MLCLFTETYHCKAVNWNKPKLLIKDLNTPVQEQSCDGLPKFFGHILEEKIFNTSINRGFCTINFAVVTYEKFWKKTVEIIARKVVASD